MKEENLFLKKSLRKSWLWNIKRNYYFNFRLVVAQIKLKTAKKNNCFSLDIYPPPLIKFMFEENNEFC